MRRSTKYVPFLVSCGGIDNQRQVTKTGLSDQMLDKKAGEKSSNCKLSPPRKKLMTAFSDAELRDLFTLSVKTDGCQTRECAELYVDAR